MGLLLGKGMGCTLVRAREGIVFYKRFFAPAVGGAVCLTVVSRVVVRRSGTF